MDGTARRQAAAGNNRRGAAAVELGIILPLLITIVLGATDFGRFAYSYIAVTNAARAGAGYGIMNPFTTTTQATWNSQVQQAVADELGSAFNSANLTVNVTTVTESDGLWRVSVTASYPFQTIVNWPFIPGFSPPLTLQRTVVLRAIR